MRSRKVFFITAVTIGLLFPSMGVFASEEDLLKLNDKPIEFINKVEDENIQADNGFIVVLKNKKAIKDKVIKDSESKDEVEVISKTQGILLVDEINDVKDLVDVKEIDSIYKDEPISVDAVPAFTPVDPLFFQQWEMLAMKTPYAWKYGYFGSPEVKVSVIDSGIYMHEDFNPRNFILNPLNDVSNVKAVPLKDVMGHGTSVTGVIAAQMNKIGIAGAAPNVKIVPIRVFDDNGQSWTSNGIKAVERAIEEGVDVINMSYSSGAPNNLEEQVINRAVEKGIIVVAAAGNMNSKTDMNNPGYRWPASYDNVVSVSGINKELTRYYWSYFNDKVDVAAPGASITTVDNKGRYVQGSGTSFSSPYVSALAALVKSVDKNINSAQFKELLRQTSTPMGGSPKNNYYGYGLINFESMLNKIAPPKAYTKSSIKNINDGAGTFDVVVTDFDAPRGLKSINVNVSPTSNPSLAKSYNATKQSDGSYKTTVSIKNHASEYGEYTAQVSITEKDNVVTKTQLLKTKVNIVTGSRTEVKNLNVNKGTFDVVVSEVRAPSTIKSLEVSVWGEPGGKNDLKTYKLVKQNDGTYKASVNIKDHKFEQGKYNLQTYVVLENKSVNTNNSSLEIKQALPTSKVAFSSVNGAKGTFDVIVSSLSAPVGLSKVEVAIWGEPGGKNDIKSYTATLQKNGTYKVSVSKKDHKNEQGKYNAQVYITQTNGIKTHTGSANATVKEPNATAKTTISRLNRNKGTFDVIVSGVNAPMGLKSIQVAVWGDPKGKNDLKWYTATRQKNGTYQVSINKKNHKNEIGRYNAHTYITQKNGVKNYTSQATVNVLAPKPEAKLTINNVNKRKGTFDVVVSSIDAPNGLSKVELPTWGSKNGKNDIKWYKAVKQRNGSYKISVNSKNHKNEKGTYNVHLYITQKDGKRVYVTSKTTSL